MASENTNKHRIRASATVSDNSGGTAYAFALDEEQSIVEIKLKIKQNKLKKEHMFEMGQFYANGTTLSVNVESFVKWGTIDGTPETSDLVSYDETTSAGQYYLFVYAVDPYKNTTIMSHPQNPIKMTTETIVLVPVTTDLLTSGHANYAEQRNNVSDAVAVLQTDKPLFDFYNGRTDKLYANISVDPKDSVVNDVSVVAFSTRQLDPAAVSGFASRTEIYNVDTSPIFGAVNDLSEKEIDKYFTGTGDTTGTSFLDHFTNNGYGDVFYVYVVMRDIGFDKWIVTEFVVTAGVPPVLTDLTVEIVPTTN